MAFRRHNLFLALRPEPEAAAAIGRLMDRLRRERGFAGRPISKHCLHLSLVSLGEHDELPHSLIERSTVALATVAMTRFVVGSNYLVTWKRRPGERPLVLLGDEGVVGIDLLLAQIHPALSTVGFRQRRAGETIPHLTLAYGGQQLPEEVVAPIRWTVQEFVLIDSLVGEGHHVVLNRWPLASADAALSRAPSSPYEGRNRAPPHELT